MKGKLDSLEQALFPLFAVSYLFSLFVNPAYIFSIGFWIILLCIFLLTFCVLSVIYLYLCLPAFRAIGKIVKNSNLDKYENLKEHIQERLNTLRLVPENSSGFAKYQVDIFQSELKKIESTNSYNVTILESIKGLSKLEKTINYFCKKRDRSLTDLEEKTHAELQELISKIKYIGTFMKNNAYLNDLEIQNETEYPNSIKRILILFNELEEISVSYIESNDTDNIKVRVSALNEILDRMKELSDYLIHICKAKITEIELNNIKYRDQEVFFTSKYKL